MSDKSINPLSAKAEYLFTMLENVSNEIITWLVFLSNGKNVCEKDIDDTQNIIDSIREQNSLACSWIQLFKPFFLLNKNKLPECFDNVLGREDIIKSIDGFFDKKNWYS
jgi:hypothetical protein